MRNDLWPLLLLVPDFQSSIQTVQVMLFLRRMENDHDLTPPTLRRSLTEKQAVVKHQACACFLHFLKIYERAGPPTEYAEAEESLTSQFMSGYLDPDLGHILESSVPPGELSGVSAFRPGPSNMFITYILLLFKMLIMMMGFFWFLFVMFLASSPCIFCLWK